MEFRGPKAQLTYMDVGKADGERLAQPDGSIPILSLTAP